MLCVKLDASGAVEKYPYSLTDMRIDNPNTSFTDFPDQASMTPFGVFYVEDVEAPQIDHTQNLQDTVQNVSGTWRRFWLTVPASAEEVSERTTTQAQSVRADRDQRLASTDWTQCKDIPDSVSSPFVAYRQALRNVPAQSGFPFNISWPVLPDAPSV